MLDMNFCGIYENKATGARWVLIEDQVTGNYLATYNESDPVSLSVFYAKKQVKIKLAQGFIKISDAGVLDVPKGTIPLPLSAPKSLDSVTSSPPTASEILKRIKGKTASLSVEEGIVLRPIDTNTKPIKIKPEVVVEEPKEIEVKPKKPIKPKTVLARFVLDGNEFEFYNSEGVDYLETTFRDGWSKIEDVKNIEECIQKCREIHGCQDITHKSSKDLVVDPSDPYLSPKRSGSINELFMLLSTKN